LTTDLTRKDFLRLGGGAVLGASAFPGLAYAGLEAPARALGGGATTLKLAHDKSTWQSWFNKTGSAAAQSIGVGWKGVPYSDTTSYQAAIRTSGRTSKVPDLYTWWSGWLMKEIVDAGFATDVTSLWQKHGAAYSKGVRAAFTFNGKTYGAPLLLAYWVVFYNKHVFAEHKLTPPKTWAQFTRILKVLRDNDVTPLAATIEGRWPGFIYFEEFVLRSDPTLYTRLMAGKAKYTDPGVVRAMRLWGRLIEEGNFTNPAAVTLGTGANNFLNVFKKGKVGMVQIGSWYEPTLLGAGMKPGVDFDAFVMPNISPRVPKVVIFETGPLAVGARGSNREDATKALDWFMSRAGQRKWVKLTGFASPRADVPPNSSVDRRLAATLRTQRYSLLNRFWEATPHDIVEVAVDQLVKFMLKPGDPMDVLRTIQKQADKTWASINKG
jgi:multiple sugar transport system substrate-binding protein